MGAWSLDLVRPDSVGQGAMKKYDGTNVRRQFRQMNSVNANVNTEWVLM